MNDWVATAPTPGSTHGTPPPTLNQRLWTATPSSPVAGSSATIEYVMGAPPVEPLRVDFGHTIACPGGTLAETAEEQQPAPAAEAGATPQRGKTVHGEPANAGHRV